MDIPWTVNSSTAKPEPDQPAFLMASRFDLKQHWRTPAFFLSALRVFQQARRSPGLLGVSLRAHPLSKSYLTLSAWTGEPALREFMRANPHRTVMGKAKPWCAEATFRFWELPAGDINQKTLWASAEQRLADGGPLQ